MMLLNACCSGSSAFSKNKKFQFKLGSWFFLGLFSTETRISIYCRVCVKPGIQAGVAIKVPADDMLRNGAMSGPVQFQFDNQQNNCRFDVYSIKSVRIENTGI